MSLSSFTAPNVSLTLGCRAHSAAIIYFILMTYVVLGMLNEVRPMWYYVLAAILFVLSQLDFFLLSKVICKVCVIFRCE